MDQFVIGFNQWNIVEVIKSIPLPQLVVDFGCVMRTSSEIVYVYPNYLPLYIGGTLVIIAIIIFNHWRFR